MQWEAGEPALDGEEPVVRGEPGDDRELGEWLRHELLERCGLEDRPRELEQVARIVARLNAARAARSPTCEPLTPVTLFMAAPVAFIGPGPYVYLTRGLLHSAWSEDGIAFAVAHEMAHHDLGHTAIFSGPLGWAATLPGFLGAAALLAAGSRILNGPEHEAAADARALHLCLAAGFDGQRCVQLLDMLAAYALDHGDVDIVYGPDEVPDPPHGDWGRRGRQVRHWLWQRVRGYPSIDERKEGLLARLRRAAGMARTSGS